METIEIIKTAIEIILCVASLLGGCILLAKATKYQNA
jgi:hypothetical protein